MIKQFTFFTFLLLLTAWVCLSPIGPKVDVQQVAGDTLTPLPPLRIPADNPQTAAGIALGRQLFFDPILSADSTISCATCHRPELAFTDGAAVSTGIGGETGRRSSPTLLNIGFIYSGMFWDGRSPDLEEQALHPIADAKEMGARWPVIVHRLRRHPVYGPAFGAAFELNTGSDLSPDHVGRALAQFQRTLISRDSKFDRVQRGEAAFTDAEKRGWTIFFDADTTLVQAECNHCHNEPLFTDQTFANNGLDAAPTLTEFADAGRGEVTRRTADNGRFRVPTLRNVLLTAPYMHDGRFATLDEVLDHYAGGGHAAPNVSTTVRPLRLTAQDRSDLLAFLATLTDSMALYNRHYQNPFVQ